MPLGENQFGTSLLFSAVILPSHICILLAAALTSAEPRMSFEESLCIKLYDLMSLVVLEVFKLMFRCVYLTKNCQSLVA